MEWQSYTLFKRWRFMMPVAVAKFVVPAFKALLLLGPLVLIVGLFFFLFKWFFPLFNGG